MAKNKRPMMLKVGDSTFDKIQAYYIDPELYPLSETNENIRQRWVMVVNLMLKTYSKFKIANMLVSDFGICHSQAYNDIRNAENMFGKIEQSENEAYKAMWLEWTKDFLKRSRQNKDRKAEGKALDLLAKYGNLDAEQLEFNPEKLLNKKIEIVLPKNTMEALKKIVSGGVVDFNSLNATDIEFEDVK